MRILFRSILGNFLLNSKGKSSSKLNINLCSNDYNNKQDKNIKVLSLEDHNIDVFTSFSEYIFLNYKEELIDIITKNCIKKISSLNFNDDYIIQIINLIDDIDKVTNTLSKRFRRFILTYLPELSLSKLDNRRVVELFLNNPRDEIVRILNLDKSMGCEVIDNSVYRILKTFAEQINSLFSFRNKLLNTLEKLEKDLIPNFSYIAGLTIAARLLAKAGSLENLAFMPASTIQLLGAEKALFRHLTKGTKSPKYGILYQHPLVQKSKKKCKGKIARLLANKLAIAIRVDYFNIINHKIKTEYAVDESSLGKHLLDQVKAKFQECNKNKKI